MLQRGQAEAEEAELRRQCGQALDVLWLEAQELPGLQQGWARQGSEKTVGHNRENCSTK